ncbi:hypothetical protein BpHYR1_001393 [Brachionus plicatilis]|uniref:Uncharacterized protein n=1 Tax=Brachionus plicatilis TaxID=10195 RepID=A0A3M7QF88_BRAPC|nr:hypothetical protein BpHYR1_001393 [Brachionus plicatilis]
MRQLLDIKGELFKSHKSQVKSKSGLKIPMNIMTRKFLNNFSLLNMIGSLDLDFFLGLKILKIKLNIKIKIITMMIPQMNKQDKYFHQLNY